jgi:hypothetical protein
MLSMTDKELRQLEVEFDYTMGYIDLLNLNIATQRTKATKLSCAIAIEHLNRFNKQAREDRYYSRLLNLCNTGR